MNAIHQQVPSPPPAGRTGGRWHRDVKGVFLAGHLALWPAVLLLALYVVFYASFAVQLISFPFDLDQGEGYDAWSAWLVRLRQLPYTSNETYPYYSSNYPPIWSSLVSLPMRWTGPGLGPARAVSAISAILAAVFIGLAARRLSGSALGGWLAAGLFLASPYVYHTTPLARVNSTALLFALVGLALVERRVSSLGSRVSGPRLWIPDPRLALGGLALLLALFTKPTAIDAALAAFGYGLLVQPRATLVAAGAAGALGVGGVLLLERASGGAFWLNVVTANVNPFDPGQLWGYYRNFLEVHPVLLALATAELVRAVAIRAWSPWVLYLPASLVLALGVGKVGAGESYFLGAIAACAVLAGAFSGRLVRAVSHQPSAISTMLPPRLVTPVLGLALLLQALLFAHGPLSEAVPWLPDRGLQAALLGRAPSPADWSVGTEIADLVYVANGPVLAEDASFAVVGGKCMAPPCPTDWGLVGNASHMRNLYQAGLWDASALVADIRARRFALVILNAQLYPPPVLEAIGRAYYLAETRKMAGATYQIFRPGGG